MYERFTHTQRTVIERGEYPPLRARDVVCILWVFFCLLLAFVFAAIDGLLIALGIGALGLLGLLLLLVLGAIPEATKPASPAHLTAPVDSTVLTLRKKELARR